MPEIRPFTGLRYNESRFGADLSAVIAPPYDVLDETDKKVLLNGHPNNIVGVDLPHVPPKSAGPDAVYAEAARQFESWRRMGIIVQEPQPAIYVYHQKYAIDGQEFTRKMFFARMKLEAFGTGSVFPHEQTFGGPKEDRLKLMRATQCQLSPVFGLYSDPDNGVSAALDVATVRPNAVATKDNVENRLWVVPDGSLIDAVCRRMAGTPVYIADGHHRYGTALIYRDELGELPADHPANYVLVGFCAMEDPGAVILPTHRVLSGFGAKKPSEILAALEKGLKTRTANPNIIDPEKLLPAGSKDDLGIYVAAGDRMYTATFTQREILKSLAPERSDAWRALDLAYLHRFLIDELITAGALGGKPASVAYLKSAAGAVEVARKENGIALLTKPCTMAELKAVSDAGDLMPQKSTYFYPKLVTGFVVNPLA